MTTVLDWRTTYMYTSKGVVCGRTHTLNSTFLNVSIFAGAHRGGSGSSAWRNGAARRTSSRITNRRRITCSESRRTTNTERVILPCPLNSSLSRVSISTFRVCLHLPSKSPFLLDDWNGFSVVLWCCLHVTSRISKVSLPKNGDVDGACKQALKVIQMLLIYILSTVILKYLLSCVCNVTLLFKLMMKLSFWKLAIVIRICSLYRKRRQIVRTMNPTLILVIVNQLRQEQEEAVRANPCRTTLAKILKKIVISKLFNLQTAICRFHFHCAHFEKW